MCGGALQRLPQRMCPTNNCTGLEICSGAGAGIQNLEWLSLQGCTGLSAAGLSQLRQCKRLQYLDLSGTQVVGLGFLQLHSAPEKGEDIAVHDYQIALPD